MTSASKPHSRQLSDRVLDRIEDVAAYGLIALGLGISIGLVLVPLVILFKVVLGG